MPCSPPSLFSVSSSATGSSLRAVDRDRLAFVERDLDVLRFGARVFRRPRELKNILRRLGPRVFENAAFVRDVHQVRVGRIRLLGRRRHGNVVLLRVRDQIRASFEVPLAPRSDDFDVRLQRVISQFETHLIVAFAGCAVSDGVSAFLAARSRSGVSRSPDGRAKCPSGRRLRKPHSL